MGETLVGVEFVGVAPPGELFGQLHTLREGGELIVDTVQEAERRQALQVVHNAIGEVLSWRAVGKPQGHQRLAKGRPGMERTHLYVVAEGKTIGHPAQHQAYVKLVGQPQDAIGVQRGEAGADEAQASGIIYGSLLS